jgi:hypothetical protein
MHDRQGGEFTFLAEQVERVFILTCRIEEKGSSMTIMTDGWSHMPTS